jgi:hypothetical protein
LRLRARCWGSNWGRCFERDIANDPNPQILSMGRNFIPSVLSVLPVLSDFIRSYPKPAKPEPKAKEDFARESCGRKVKNASLLRRIGPSRRLIVLSGIILSVRSGSRPKRPPTLLVPTK